MRFRKQPAGIEGHDVDRRVFGEDGVGDGLILKTEARGEDNRARDIAADVGDPLEQVASAIAGGEAPGDVDRRAAAGRMAGAFAGHAVELVSLEWRRQGRPTQIEEFSWKRQ